MLTRFPVDPLWQLRSTGGPVPATIEGRLFEAPVPGDVHTALRRADAIPDPVVGENEEILQWIGESDWEYMTNLPCVKSDAERIDVVFHGVDTIAHASIDGQLRGASRNMHRTWRTPAPELADRTATLGVSLWSPVAAGLAEQARLGERWAAFSPIAPFIRKKACDFGWDWGPALPGAGIWRRVEIEAWSTARLTAVRPTARLAGADGLIDLDVEISRAESGQGADLDIVATIAGRSTTFPVPAGSIRACGTIPVDAPELWWPAGLGSQTLHDLTVSVRRGDAILDERTLRVGFRDLVVEQVEDESGASFGITVNGVALFIRGFNWIPDDTSIALVTETDIRRRISQARELGANLIRVWGGGVFEDDAFYEACDEAGMLVWQDFLFACGAYPEEAPFTAEVEAEARDNVSRLMHHPSLALWNGNNENLWFWFLHDWETLLDGRSWGEGLYFDVLPRVVADLDPGRTYLVGSPSSGDRWHDPNDPSRGVIHSWIPDDYRAYDDVRPRFVSEFGFQGPPARATFDEAVKESDPAPFSPGTIQRQKAEGGTERINDVLHAHFGVPVDFEEWYWLAQLNQARAVRYGIERFRVLEPYCRGTVLWQLNDCWPALSWSVIDVADRWKPAAYAVREAYRDRIVVLRIEDGEPALFACNSSEATWTVRVDLQRFRGGAREAGAIATATVPPHHAQRVAIGSIGEHLEPDELLVASAEGSRSTLLGATDREFADVDPEYDLSVQRSRDTVTVSLTAHTLVRDAVLAVEDVDPDAHSDVNLLTLLPGESATWTVQTAYPGAFSLTAIRAALRFAHAATATDPDYRGLALLEAEKAERRATTEHASVVDRS